MKSRILLLNPPVLAGGIWMKEIGRCGRRAIAGETWPQTGLAMLAAMVEREGHEALIIDAMAEPVGIEEIIERCLSWRPSMIVINSATPTIRNDAEILARLKKTLNVCCGFAGPHVSALPEETLRESEADFGMVNEAEETMAELTRAVAVGGDLRAQFGQIRGIVWKGEDGRIVLNEPRALIENLDALPFPARHLLPNANYRMPFFEGKPFATIIPTRGCPWPCTFCRAGRVWGRKIRTRSVGNILAEIQSLQKEFGIHSLVFMTDSLTLNRKWAGEFLEALANLKESVEWICNSRVDAVDEEMLRLMKKAGCRQVAYGLESGSQGVLDQCRKGTTVEQNARVIEMTRRAGLQSMAYFVLGLPGETRRTVQETIDFARRVEPDYVNFHIATPFPGTALYDEALEKGWLVSRNWEEYEEEGSAVMKAGELSPLDLRLEQRRAMRAFYLRPSRLLKELRRVRSWPEFSAKAGAALRIFSILGTKGNRRSSKASS